MPFCPEVRSQRAQRQVIFPLWTKWLVTNPMPTQYWHEVMGGTGGVKTHEVYLFKGYLKLALALALALSLSLFLSLSLSLSLSANMHTRANTHTYCIYNIHYTGNLCVSACLKVCVFVLRSNTPLKFTGNP